MVPLAFVVTVLVGWTQRNRGMILGRRLEALVALLGGLSLGTFILWTAGDLLLESALFVGTAAAVVAQRWRAGRRAQAGLVLAGFALPWTLLWGFYLTALLGGEALDPGQTWLLSGGGLAVTLIGVAVAVRGDPARPGASSSPLPGTPAGQPGSRSLGTLGAAIFEPMRIGPVRAPDLAALVAFVVAWLAAAFIPFPNAWLRVVAGAAIGSVAATEAYIRAWPSRSRRAFEAFSWLGEWDMARVRELTGSGVPVTTASREAWLARHPDTPETGWIRAEVLIALGRLDEARGLIDRLPADTPAERLERESERALLDWMAGHTADLAALEAAVGGILPVDSDDRLRAEVGLAQARARRLAGEYGAGGDEVLAPLLEVRERLGRRADGQLGRALRRRLLPWMLVFSGLIGLAFIALGSFPI